MRTSARRAPARPAPAAARGRADRALSGLPELARALSGLPGLARVLRGLPGLARVLRGLPGLARVLRGLPELARARREPRGERPPRGAAIFHSERRAAAADR